MTEEGYNGWENWETWCVHLWLTNDEGTYDLTRETVAAAVADEREPSWDWRAGDAIRDMIEEYKDEGNYAWYKLRYRDKKFEFFLAELKIYKDSPYVSADYRRCARDLLQADWEKYCEAFWDIFAR